MKIGHLLGKIKKEFKKVRNDYDERVAKYKAQIDKINQLNESKIIYDRETAYVEVPRYDGKTENLKWAWISSGREKSAKTVEEFKQILDILEATSNKTQYHSLVSQLNTSTKNALDANIQKYNITVPLQETTQLISAMALSLDSDITVQDTAREVLVSRDDTDYMMFSSASSANPIGYNALNFLKEQVGKIQELTLSNFIESLHRWYQSDEYKISEEIIVMKDSNIVSDNVSNLDDLMLDTNIFSSQAALTLNNVPLLSNEYSQDLISTTNNAFNMNGTLMLGNLLVRIMNRVIQKKITTNDNTSNTHEIIVENNIVDSEHAHRLAYSSYAHDIDENAEYIELVGVGNA